MHVARQARRDTHPRVDHHHLMRDAHHQRHVVLDQEHRDAGARNPFEQFGEARLVLARQAGGRFVKQQHGR